MLPLATSTYTIHRLTSLAATPARDPYGEGYGSATDGPGAGEPAAYRDIARGVRGVVGGPVGFSAPIGGKQEEVTYRLDLDPTDITYNDEITDETSGQRYRVVWATRRTGMGLNHSVGAVRTVRGDAQGPVT